MAICVEVRGDERIGILIGDGDGERERAVPDSESDGDPHSRVHEVENTVSIDVDRPNRVHQGE